MMNQAVRMMWALFLATAFGWGGSVTAKVDSSEVTAGDSIILTIEAVGSDIEFPDINTIGDSPVLRRSEVSSMGITSINGQNKMERNRRVLLTFTPQKEMTIPPYSVTIDGQKLQTNPIKIKIAAPQTVPKSTISDKFTLDMVADKRELFVGEPLLVSVFFGESRQADLMQVQYQKPSFGDFVVKEEEPEKQYRKGKYLIHELRYLLIPKHDGNLTIEPSRAKVAERSRRKDDIFGNFFDTPRWSHIASNAVSINVKPLPGQTDLVGDFELNENIDTTQVKANKPVNLTVTIQGEGGVEDFNGLSLDIDGVTIYSDDAKVESKLVGDQLIATYEKRFALIADRNFTIPSQSFSVFNYKSGKIETLKTKFYQIEVIGGTVAPAVVQSAKPKSQEVGKNTFEPSPNKKEGNAGGYPPWVLALVFVSGVFAALAALKLIPKLKFKKPVNPANESEALKILYPHTGKDPIVEEMVRLLYARQNGDKSAVIDKKLLKALVNRYMRKNER
jgi:hypothetical protein